MTICPDQLWKALHHVWPSAKLPALPDLPQQLSLRTDSRMDCIPDCMSLASGPHGIQPEPNLANLCIERLLTVPLTQIGTPLGCTGLGIA